MVTILLELGGGSEGTSIREFVPMQAGGNGDYHGAGRDIELVRADHGVDIDVLLDDFLATDILFPRLASE